MDISVLQEVAQTFVFIPKPADAISLSVSSDMFVFEIARPVYALTSANDIVVLTR